MKCEKYPLLFEPTKIGNIKLKNRIAMSAMGTGFANHDGTASDRIIRYYEERAKGGAGLIFTEICRIDGETGLGNFNQLGAYEGYQMKSLRSLTEAVHRHDTKIFLQLHHPGRVAQRLLLGGKQAVAPSAIPDKVVAEMPRELTTEECEALVKKFCVGAYIAKAAGFDGIELHADAWRVLCNVGVAACALIPYALWKDHRFLYVYAAVMAESLADSLASKAGPLTRYATVDICTFRKISPGLSGGVSLLGTLSGLLGACIIAVLCTGFPTATLKIAATVAMTGFAGCLFDSVLGSVVQVKYLCTVCGMLVERDMHCGTAAIPCRGVRFITNDAVNILSNFFTFLLAAAVL